MFMSPWDRLDAELARKRSSWTSLADVLGTTKQAVGHWKTRGIPARSMREAAEFVGKTRDWLEFGDPSQSSSTTDHTQNPAFPLAGRAGGATETIAELVIKLGAALDATDPITRAQTAPILEQLSKTPELAAELGARLEATIKMGTQAPFIPVNPFPKK